VHDQRQRRRFNTSYRYIKVSSPTLRKLCLPCITARNHHSITKKPPKKINQQQAELAPRTYDLSTTVPAVHSSEYLLENDANHTPKQQRHEHCEISSHHDETVERNSNEISLTTANLPTKVDSETLLLKLSPSGNEITRSNDDYVVGTFLKN